MARLPRARGKPRGASLLRRINRHALRAGASLESQGVELVGLKEPGWRSDSGERAGGVAAPPGPVARTGRTGFHPPSWAFMMGGAILIGAVSAAVVTAPEWIGRLASFGEALVAEGVLVGAPSAADDGDAPQTGMDPSQSVSPALAAATPTASPHSLLFDFNDVPMGGGIGEGWVQSIGRDEAVEVAAHPTSVDRSARLVVTDGAPVAICRSVRPTLTEVRRFSADMILDPEVPATGIIELSDAAGDAVLRLNLARARTRLSSGPSLLGEAGGLDPGHRYHIDVLLGGGGGSRWRMAQLNGLPAQGVEVPFEATLLASVGEICLGAEGPRGAAVNYDNLVITNE